MYLCQRLPITHERFEIQKKPMNFINTNDNIDVECIFNVNNFHEIRNTLDPEISGKFQRVIHFNRLISFKCDGTLLAGNSIT